MTRALLRLARALPLTIAVLVVGAFSAFVHVSPPLDTRAVSLTVASAMSLGLLLPTVAVAGAFTGAVSRGFNGLLLSANRSRVQLVVVLAALQGAVGLLGVLLNVALLGLRVDTWPLPYLPVIGVLFLTLTAASALGQVVGWCWGVVIGAPTVLVLAFAIMAFPPALSHPLWLRHLFLVKSCCTSSTDLDPAVLWAQVLVWTSLLVAAAIISLRAGIGILKFAASIGVVSMAINVAAGWVNHLDYSSATLRTTALVCEQFDGREFCIWPENVPARENLEAAAANIEQVAQAHDVELPTKFTEQRRPDGSRGEGHFYIPNPAARRADLEHSLALATTADPAQCAPPGEGYDVRFALAKEVIVNWWLEELGYPPAFSDLPPEADDLLISSDVSAEVDALTAAIRDCDTSAIS